MIVVKVNRSKNKIEFLGHSLYDDYGKDIVCSAVSSIFITTVNGILRITKDSIKTFNKKDLVILEIKKRDNITISLIENMLLLLRDLEEQYPKNIKIQEDLC